MHEKVEERVKVISAVLYEGGMWAYIRKDYSARMNMLHAMYSGLKNCCNVWQFWSSCKVALD